MEDPRKAFNGLQWPNRFNRIITHWHPHHDELVAIKMAWDRGDETFPGIGNSTLDYNRTGDLFENKTWQQHFEEGTLCVGTNGGPLDEHPTAQGESRKQQECAASLMNTMLGLQKDSIWKPIVADAIEADTELVHRAHVASVMKSLYRVHPDNHRIAMDFGFAAIDAQVSEQICFIKAQKYVSGLAETDAHFTITRGKQDLHIIVARSDNPKIGSAARSYKIAVVIQQQRSGFVQISSDTVRYGFDMRYFVAALRKAECARCGMSKGQIKKIDPDAFMVEGKMPEVPQWFYFKIKGVEFVFNGTETTPDTTPTKIPLDEIARLARTFIDVQQDVEALV